jgi:hypothetical protein
MAIDSNGNTYENRTLQFYGLAYGDSNVSLTATINGNIVFSGEVPTTNSPLPLPPVDDQVDNAVLLFSLPDSPLFPSNQTLSYPVSISVSGGYGVILSAIYSNYTNIPTPIVQAVLANSTISGTTLTIGSVISGNVAIGQIVNCYNNNVVKGSRIAAGSGLTWTVEYNKFSLSDILTATDMTTHTTTMTNGTATDFVKIEQTGCEDITENLYHDVTIEDVVQPVPAPHTVYGPFIVPTGSTLAYNLKLIQGNIWIPTQGKIPQNRFT